ncbi:MAG: prepilin-type N-terminal cleavage/methylation domain-containing protein [Pseudomonadota bacterium]
MKIQRHIQQGFTLIELMIVVAIIGILAAIAIPQYTQYTRKARFSEIVSAASPFKTAVEVCMQDLNVTSGAPSACGNGSNGVPAAPTAAVGLVSTVVVSAAGAITVTPVATQGLVATDTYVLTPNASNGAVTWTKSGGCTSSSLC